MDLQRELEQAIGHGPQLPAPQDRLAAGRAALRRRRVVVAGTGAAVAAVMVIPVAFAVGGTGVPTPAPAPAPAGPAPAATSGTAPEPTAEEPAPAPRWRAWETIRYTGDGRLEIRPGVEVLDRVDDYLDGTRWERSVALEIRWQGTTRWVAAEWDAQAGSSTSDTEASDGWADFRAWVAAQAAANMPGREDPGDGYPELVVPMGDGVLAAAPGATILEQQADPDLPESFAPASDPTSAAYVEKDGDRYLVLTRPGQVITVPSVGHGESLAELLAWARERYESGEGLL